MWYLQVIHHVDYEDDLDVTWLSVIHQRPDRQACICLHDNTTFQKLREIDLGVIEAVDEVING